jgi:hypothetical protein
MLIGDFREAMKAGLDDAKPYVRLESGIFNDALSFKRTSGFSFDFFGFKAATTSILSSDIEVEYDFGGTIRVFESRAAVEEVRALFGESQSVRLSSAARLIDASDQQDLVPFSVRLNYQDEDLEMKELEQFLGTIASAGLLSAGSAESAAGSYEKLGVPDSDGERALNIDVNFPLTLKDVEDLAALPRDQVIRKAITVQLRMQHELMTENRRALNRLEQKTGSAVDFIVELVDSSSQEIRRRVRRQVYNFTRTTGGPPGAAKLSYLVAAMRSNAEALYEYLQGITELRQNAPTAVPTEGELRELERKHRELVAELDGWAKVTDGALLKLTDARVSVWSVALLATLKELSGHDYRAVPIVSWTDEGRTERMVIL